MSKPDKHGPNVITDVIWIDLGIAWPKHDALAMEIDAGGKDEASHVVAAHGPVSFIGLTPYDELESFAQSQGWNYGVFGYDWRRPLAESARYFKRFISQFRRRVMRDFGIDPIRNLTVVCHSMGGTVCTEAIRDAAFCKLGFHAIMTIATPFYGTSTHQERYFSGGPDLLNFIYGAKTVARITASLPGPYTLMFLPKSVYDRVGRRLGLSRYPQYDPNGNTDADPYDPRMMERWPPYVRSHRGYIAAAKTQMERIAAPINPAIVPRFFNVRSSLDPRTAVELLWSNVDGDEIIPGETPSPLAGIPGPGDGTVPAWSAFHAHCRHKHDLRQASDHGMLLEHQEVLEVIDAIVATRRLPAAVKRRKSSPAIASQTRATRAAATWAANAKRRRAPPPDLFEAPVKRAILKSLIEGKKPRMKRRRS